MTPEDLTFLLNCLRKKSELNPEAKREHEENDDCYSIGEMEGYTWGMLDALEMVETFVTDRERFDKEIFPDI